MLTLSKLAAVSFSLLGKRLSQLLQEFTELSKAKTDSFSVIPLVFLCGTGVG